MVRETEGTKAKLPLNATNVNDDRRGGGGDRSGSRTHHFHDLINHRLFRRARAHERTNDRPRDRRQTRA